MSDFEWSPKDNVLAYWAPEQANAPARVSVVEIPSRNELRQKNLVMVSECRLHWQASTFVSVSDSVVNRITIDESTAYHLTLASFSRFASAYQP